MFQAEILKQQQEKVESQNVKEEFRQETTMLQAQILKLQQENLTLESENSTLKDVNEKQDHGVQKKNRREQNKSRKQTGKVSMPTPTQSSTIFVDDSSSDETSSEQEETKIRKWQLQKQECDTFQRPSEDMRKLSHRPQLPSQSERNELLTGNKKEKPEMPARSQFRLPSKVIQVKPAAPVSKLLEQPAELDKMSTAKPKYPSVSTSSSGEESETGGDTSEQEEDKRKLSRRPQLPRQSERNELQTDKKLTGNKKEKPEMPGRSQLRLPSKDIQVKPVAPVSELLDQPAEPDKTPRAKPKYPSYSIISSDEESETGGDTSQQQEVMRIWSIRPWLPSDSGGSEQETHNKLDVNKKGEPGKVSSAGRSAKAQPEATTSTEAPKKFSFLNIFKNLKKKFKGKTEKKEQNEVKSEKPVEGRQSQQQTNKTQQKQQKSKNICIKRSAASSQPAASQLEQKTTVNKYPWFRPKK
ncbi:uncharacterized protein isoform X2 [Takifugu rubripes]|uniref:uncharacterized protein isoform X2 n=1 Tax=Takifugu rubripes TaxID=31033 RepID=UPI001145FBDF|nr:uncharacterized protein LOC115246955 isoform X2 [Takifugu rubripes]